MPNVSFAVTKAADIDQRTMVTMLSRMSLRPSEAGTYTCCDSSDLLNGDHVEVEVKAADQGQSEWTLICSYYVAKLKVKL